MMQFYTSSFSLEPFIFLLIKKTLVPFQTHVMRIMFIKAISLLLEKSEKPMYHRLSLPTTTKGMATVLSDIIGQIELLE